MVGFLTCKNGNMDVKRTLLAVASSLEMHIFPPLASVHTITTRPAVSSIFPANSISQAQLSIGLSLFFM